MKLGEAYESGKEIPKDTHQAFLCYETAMKSEKWDENWDHMKAYLKMEQVYRDGVGTVKNPAKAAEVLQKALELTGAKAYDKACLYSLRSMYWSQSPEGIQAAAKDKAEAIKLLNQAVDQGYRDYRHMDSDSDLKPLRNDAAFQQVVQRCKTQVDEAKAAEDAKKAAVERQKQEAIENRINKLKDAFSKVMLNYNAVDFHSDRSDTFNTYYLIANDEGFTIKYEFSRIKTSLILEIPKVLNKGRESGTLLYKDMVDFYPVVTQATDSRGRERCRRMTIWFSSQIKLSADLNFPQVISNIDELIQNLEAAGLRRRTQGY